MCTGSSASVSIIMSNDGQSNWAPPATGSSNPFMLESQNPEGNTNWGVSTLTLSQPVLWYQSYAFSFNAVAPMVPGTYNFQWRMLDQGVGAFGDYTPNLVVNVVPCGDFGVSANPVTANVGQTGTSTITLTSLSGFAGQI